MNIADFKLIGNDADELEVLLKEFNNTHSDYPRDKRVEQIFRDVADRYPDAIALVDGERRITYKELDEASDRICGFLKSQHIHPEERVGILMDRSAETIESILGILKSGASYVALSEEYPVERIQYMIFETQIRIVLTVEKNKRQIDALRPGVENGCCVFLNVDEMSLVDMESDAFLFFDRSQINKIPTLRPESCGIATSLAHIIYTSGSTGRPKGVMIEHRGIVRLVKSTNYVSICPGDKITQNSPLSFDGSTFEIWGALLNGAQLHLIKKETLLDARKFKDAIQAAGINRMLVITSLFNSLVETDISLFSGIETILIGGERLSCFHVNKVREAFPLTTIVNAYGPTENTTISTAFQVDQNYSENVPIGRPVANSTCYILRGDNMLPVGIVGEICVAGDGLARGYLGDNDLTREKFTPNPFRPGERLYRTGDMGRWLPDGNIEYIGRKDGQLKIRGYRVEPSEIEQFILRNYEAVGDVAVVPKSFGGQVQLVCYFVSSDGRIDGEWLKQELGTKLPDYLVPIYFVIVDSIPLSANGKRLTEKLPEPLERNASVEPIEPSNETEAHILKIWQEVLECGPISIHDNFFAVGGHSLKAIQILFRIQEELFTSTDLHDIFDNPTVKALSDVVVRNKKRQYVQIPEAPPREFYPLSHAQKRLWIFDQLNPGTTAYNITGVYGLDGSVDSKILEMSFVELVARHEILRTSFEVVDSLPVQKIHPFRRDVFRIEVVDLRTVEGDKASIVNQLQQDEATQFFDLTALPLMRVKLILVDGWHSFLLFTIHHIVADGWSIEILMRELSRVYTSLKGGKRPSLPRMAIQYKDFTVWQHDFLQGENSHLHRKFWHDTLSGELPVLNFPCDCVRPSIKTYNGRLISRAFGVRLTRALREIASKNDVTLFMVLTAMLKTLLFRYTGLPDVIVGTNVAGRIHKDLEDQIGFYVNSIALRTAMSGPETFTDLLARIKQTTLNAFEHQAYPYDKLIEELITQGDLSRAPFFDVVIQHIRGFDVSDSGSAEVRPTESVDVTAIGVETRTAKYDLFFSFNESVDDLTLGLEFNTDLFKPSSIERLIVHFQELAENVVRDPETQLSKIEFIPAKERMELVGLTNLTKPNYPRNETIVSRFESIAKRFESREAVVFHNRSISYGELDVRANQVAAFLVQHAVKAEGFVGIMMDRSEWMIVAILGVLRAGAAYVPIDPTYPESRVMYILGDTCIDVLMIDNEAYVEKFNLGATHTRCLNILDEWNSIVALPKKVDNVAIQPSAPAYVIYTSGSTGDPKGVVVEHQNLIQLFFNKGFQFEVGHEDTWSLFHSICFDFSVWEIFGALLFGGKLVVVDYQTAIDPEKFAGLIVEQKVTMLSSIPSMFLLVSEPLLNGNVSGAPSLRYVVFGGEALKPIALKRWFASYPHVELINMYGITETTIHTTFKQISKEEIQSGDSNIGHPLPSSSVYILDSNEQLLPYMAVGEIAVGGYGVTRGYLNKPEQTRGRFIPNPFEQGNKLYLSGDFGFRKDDGDIVYVGRKDQQVKIRGHRIEIGEIEKAILRYDGIRTALVLTRKDGAGLDYLIAYFTWTSEQYSIADLRRHVTSLVPDFMVPSHFVRVADFPLTLSGKIDTRKLPDPETVGREEWSTFFAPSSPLQVRLCTLWSELLGVEKIGVRDNFFEIGGHSLKIMQLVARIHQEFNIRIEMRSVFLNPTVEQLEQLMQSKGHDQFQEIGLVDIAAHYELSYAQKRLWLIHQFDPLSVAYSISGLYNFKGNLQMDLLRKSVKILYQRHESLRTYFMVVDDEPQQIIVESNACPLEISFSDVSELDSREELARATIEAEVARPFDLTQPPLIRVSVVKVDANTHIFAFTMHHIISDGWSMQILFRELAAQYDALLLGNEVGLPPLRIQYKDYAHWQKSIIAADEKYWFNKLAGDVRMVALPYDFARSSQMSYRGKSISSYLDEATVEVLNAIAARRSTTLSNVVLSLFNIFLHHISSQTEINIGIAIANRTHRDVENLVGFFVNTLVIRNTFDGDIEFDEIVGRVTDTVTEAYAHQNYPFDLLVERLNPQRLKNHQTIFNVMYAFQNFEDVSLSVPESTLSGSADQLGIAPYYHEHRVSFFDLTHFVYLEGGKMKLEFLYNTDLFLESTVREFLEGYVNIISTIRQSGGRTS